MRVTETGGTLGWPTRPRILIDGVPLIDSLFSTLAEDVAINLGVGSSPLAALTSTAAQTSNLAPPAIARPVGTLALSYRQSMSQRGLGLLETGEIWPSTNPGTQIEIGGFPWGTAAASPMTLNAVVGQVVPSGALVRGLPEA